MTADAIEKALDLVPANQIALHLGCHRQTVNSLRTRGRVHSSELGQRMAEAMELLTAGAVTAEEILLPDAVPRSLPPKRLPRGDRLLAGDKVREANRLRREREGRPPPAPPVPRRRRVGSVQEQRAGAPQKRNRAVSREGMSAKERAKREAAVEKRHADKRDADARERLEKKEAASKERRAKAEAVDREKESRAETARIRNSAELKAIKEDAPEGFDFGDTATMMEVQQKADTQKKIADSLLAEEKLKEKRISTQTALGNLVDAASVKSRIEGAGIVFRQQSEVIIRQIESIVCESCRDAVSIAVAAGVESLRNDVMEALQGKASA